MADLERIDGAVTDLIEGGLLQNAQTGMGTSLSGGHHTRVGYGYLLSESELRSLYRSSWLLGRVVDTPPQDMAKAGIELSINDGDEEDVAKVNARYADLNNSDSPFEAAYSVDAAFEEAYRWARLFGTAYIIVQCNGGEDPSKPLKDVRSLDGLSVLDCYQLSPDLGEWNYVDPTYYRLSHSERMGGDRVKYAYGTRIHRSRVLRFEGTKLHPWDIQYCQGRSDSVVQRMFEVFQKHYEVKDSVYEGLNSFSLMKVAITNLSQLIGAGKLTEIKNHLKEIALQKSVHRVLLTDDQIEKTGFQERSFSGVSENVRMFIEELTAASGLPFYKLWGTVGQAALADSGGAETRAYAEYINGCQNSIFRPNHTRILKMLMAAELGRIPEDWSFEYKSIYSPTPQEEAALEQMKAATYEKYVVMGATNGQEIRKAIATGQPLANVIDLDVDPVVQAAEEQGQAAVAQSEVLSAIEPREDAIDFNPPQTVQEAFARAVRMLDKGQLKPGDGLEPATVRWARRLAKGEAVSPQKARMGYKFFQRNQRFKDADKDSAAWASWALWGYDEGRSWFNGLWRQMNAAEDRADVIEQDPDTGEWLLWDTQRSRVLGRHKSEAEALTQERAIAANRNDGRRSPSRRILKWKDFEIGVQYFPFQRRHGRTLSAGYGHLRRTRGADGMALDCYIGTNLSSDRMFVVTQLIEGKFDEEKIMIGFTSPNAAEQAYLEVMPAPMYGGIREISLEDLEPYRVTYETRADFEPIEVSGEVLSDRQWEDLSAVSEVDALRTIEKIVEDQ